MSLHVYNTRMTFCVADAAQGEIDVAIHYEYTPPEKGCGHDAYRGPEPDHPASVGIFLVRTPGANGGRWQDVPHWVYDAVKNDDYIEQLLIEHAESA